MSDGAKPGDGERRAFHHGGRRIVQVDSVTQVRGEDAGAVVVTGSHGGISSGRYAAAVRGLLYAFNDAGVGKGGAGIAALADLDSLGIAAVAVGHDTARIGSARETWDGRIAHANGAAAALGIVAGSRLADAVERLTALPAGGS